MKTVAAAAGGATVGIFGTTMVVPSSQAVVDRFATDLTTAGLMALVVAVFAAGFAIYERITSTSISRRFSDTAVASAAVIEKSTNALAQMALSVQSLRDAISGLGASLDRHDGRLDNETRELRRELGELEKHLLALSTELQRSGFGHDRNH